jgi:hypothetical protein
LPQSRFHLNVNPDGVRAVHFLSVASGWSMPPLRLLVPLALPLLLAACADTSGTGQAPQPAPAPPPPPAASAPTPAPAAPAPAPAAVSNAGELGFLWGRWSADPARCDSQAIAISATRFEGAENVCDLSGLTDAGDGSYAANLACTSQGRSSSERLRMTPVFAPSGEGLVLVYPDRSPDRVLLLRCGG